MIRYDPEEHRYFLDGMEVPSVSTIAKIAAPLPWIRPTLLSEAADRGSKVHDMIALEIIADLDEDALDEGLRGYLEAWRKFLADSGFAPLFTEQVVASRKLRFAGRVDLIGTFASSDVLHLVDLKTGVIPDSVGPQTAGYALAWNESFPTTPIHQRHALLLAPDGEYRLTPLVNSLDFRAFKAALDIHAWRQHQ